MKARVPNFGKSRHAKPVVTEVPLVRKSHSSGYLSLLRQNDKTFDSGRGITFLEFYGNRLLIAIIFNVKLKQSISVNCYNP